MKKLPKEIQVDWMRAMPSSSWLQSDTMTPENSEKLKSEIRSGKDHTDTIMEAYLEFPYHCDGAILDFYFEKQAAKLILTLREFKNARPIISHINEPVKKDKTFDELSEAEQLFAKELCEHDWYYMYSDSHNVQANGDKSEEALEEKSNASPELKAMWEEACKYRNDTISKGYTNVTKPSWWK